MIKLVPYNCYESYGIRIVYICEVKNGYKLFIDRCGNMRKYRVSWDIVTKLRPVDDVGFIQFAKLLMI